MKFSHLQALIKITAKRIAEIEYEIQTLRLQLQYANSPAGQAYLMHVKEYISSKEDRLRREKIKLKKIVVIQRDLKQSINEHIKHARFIKRILYHGAKVA